MMLGCHGDALLGGSSPVGGGGLSLGPVGGGLGADIKSLYAVAAVKLYGSGLDARGLDALDGLVKHEHGVAPHGHGGPGPSAAASASSQQLHRSYYHGYDPGVLAGLHQGLHHHQQQHAAH